MVLVVAVNKWRQPDQISARSSLQFARCAGRYVIYSARTLVGPFPVIESLPAFPYIHSWLS